MAKLDFLAGMTAAKAVVLGMGKTWQDALGWSCADQYRDQFAIRIQGAINSHTQEGQVLDRDYLVFWQSMDRGPAGAGYPPREASVVRVSFPPHEEPRGSILDGFAEAAILKEHPHIDDVSILGVSELANPVWSRGHSREVSLGNGRAARLECGAAGWVLHL